MRDFCSERTVGLLILGIIQRRVLFGLGRALFIVRMTDQQIEIPKLPSEMVADHLHHRFVTAFRTS